MRAVTYDGYGRTPVMVEVAAPVAPPGGIVVEVRATGVCRSDWHAWQGHDPVPAFPHVPGHEYAGVVAAVGEGVRTWAVGDRVVVPFALGCGTCSACVEGAAHVCPRNRQPGFTEWGSFAELVAVPWADANAVALPESVGFLEAAALGCRFATSFHAVVERAQVQAGEWAAVHGCGGVGLSAIMVAVALGARVVAVDVDTAALDAARALGAHECVAGGPGAGERVLAATAGGAHVALDGIGGRGPMTESILSLRPRGRHVQVGLMLGDDAVPPVPMGLVLARELTLLGSHGMPQGEYAGMLELVADGRLDPRRLVGQVVGLDGAGAALAAMSGPPSGAGMTVVDLALR